MDKGAIIASYEPVVDIVARPQEFSGEQPIQSILEYLEGLNEDQRTALQKLIQEFRNLFSTYDADVGHCNVTQHKIDTEYCQKSFNKLKQALTTSRALTYPRTNEDFILDTDTSNEGKEAVLSQKIGNEECVVAYFSKSLDESNVGYILEVDLDYSSDLHDEHSDSLFPFAPENKPPPNCKEPRLLTTLEPKTKYVLHYSNILKLGSHELQVSHESTKPCKYCRKLVNGLV
ncbi:retrovirus-related Pol polyprotein from transposon 297 [Nephila pilipes]|uniref:Retrovirus-related Pol polyprotein from transposon 297 n=1 Tax=Nephila pilipes TaxID=299642 RepID=A0A8X6U8R9_NEPPI|nr:retrovirus-related Pol polyprotein from transposon 297 [Nephila pilipes]